MKMEFWKLLILKTTSKSTLTAKLTKNKHKFDAGDNPELMIAPSAYQILTLTTKYFTENNGEWVEIFEYSNDPEEELFNVRFSLVGPNRKLHFENAASISRIYEYIAPINTVPQGIIPNYPAGGSYKNSSSYLLGKCSLQKTAVDLK
jgi:hypothetical protein